jgi:hypothetical protein
MSRQLFVLFGILAAFGITLGGQGMARADVSVQVSTIDAYLANGSYAGYGQWNADPVDGIPGDSIRACDTVADGWGVETWLDIHRDGVIDRVASTRGHNASYCTGWQSGNIAEGTAVDIYVCTVQGDSAYCRGPFGGSA